MESMLPRVQATSMAWRIARSTRLGVVLNLAAISGYSVLVMAPSSSMLLYTMVIASRRYWYPLMWAGTPISWMMLVLLAFRCLGLLLIGMMLELAPFPIEDTAAGAAEALPKNLVKSNHFEAFNMKIHDDKCPVYRFAVCEFIRIFALTKYIL